MVKQNSVIAITALQNTHLWPLEIQKVVCCEQTTATWQISSYEYPFSSEGSTRS